jgi:hypothetical protein
LFFLTDSRALHTPIRTVSAFAEAMADRA